MALIAHLAGLGALKFDLMIGAKGFNHCIEALTGPRDQLTKSRDSDPIVAFAEAVIGRFETVDVGPEVLRTRRAALGRRASCSGLVAIAALREDFTCR